MTASRRAKRVIAAVNPNTLHTFGDSTLHVTEIDAFVPDDRPFAPPPIEGEPADAAIAHHVGELIEDGDTIQVGIGSHTVGMMDAGFLQDKQELSYFGELTVRGLVPLVERGVITGRTSQLHPGKFVATVIGNTPEERATVYGNRAFEMRGIEYLLDPRTIAQNDRIVAVNGALGIDLSGQTAVYTIGPRIYAGLGGHLAFALGAYLSPRGRYVCVMPSTAMGARSRRSSRSSRRARWCRSLARWPTPW